MNNTERYALQDVVKSQNQRIEELNETIVMLKTKSALNKVRIKKLPNLTLTNLNDILKILES